jgi:hypothetical protein
MIEDMVFQIISSSPIPRKPPLVFGMATRTDQFSSVGILPVSKTYWTSSTTVSHVCVSGDFSRRAASLHSFKSSGRIPVGPGILPLWSRPTAFSISASEGIESSILKGETNIGTGLPAGGSLASNSP